MMDLDLILELVLKHFRAELVYVPAGMQVAAVVTVVAMLVYLLLCRKKAVGDLFRFFCFFFLVTYLYCVLQLTILSRHPGFYGDIDWRILAKWHENLHQKAFFVENVLMFFPLGILFPAIFRRVPWSVVTLPMAFLFSAAIEYVQLKYQLGYCQLDDVFANMMGFLMGYVLFLLVAGIVGIIRWIVRMIRN